MNEVLSQAAKRRWEKVRQLQLLEICERKKLNGYLEKKAFLIGCLMGDGSVFHYTDKNFKDHYCISFYPDSLRVTKLYVKYFYEVYGIKLKIKQEKNYFSVRIKNRVIYDDLQNCGPFDSLHWSIPLNDLSSKKAKCAWISAFFDCEANVGKRMIQVQSVNCQGILAIQRLLQEFSIESKTYVYVRKKKSWNVNYILCIMKKESRVNYLNEIGFNHPKKQYRLAISCRDRIIRSVHR